jgi:hypothetical protein
VRSHDHSARYCAISLRQHPDVSFAEFLRPSPKASIAFVLTTAFSWAATQALRQIPDTRREGRVVTVARARNAAEQFAAVHLDQQ